MAKKRTEQEVILKYKVEQNAQVQAANDAVKKSLQDIEKAAKKGGVAGAQEFKRLATEGKKLESEMKSIRRGFDSVGSDAPDELQKVIDKLEKLNKTIRTGTDDVRDFDDEFGKSRQRVALAGDVESQLRTAGGTFGAVGGRNVEQAIGVGAEIPALVEALPLLKDSLRGLPDAIKSAATSLGPVGLGFTAVIVGAGAAFAVVAGQIQKQTDTVKALLTVQEDYFDVVATGTTQIAQARVEEARASNLSLLARKVELTAQIAAAEQTQRSSGLFVAAAIDLQGSLDTNPIEEMEKALETLNTGIIENNRTIGVFNQGLEDNVFATESATEALERLNQEEAVRTGIILAGAEATRQRVVTERQLMRQSEEALEQRLTAIDDEAVGIGNVIRELSAIKDPSAQILAQIAAEQQRFDVLRQERGFILQSANVTAKARREEEESALALAEAEETLSAERKKNREEMTAFVKESLEKRIELEKRFADDLISISERAAEAATKALRNLEGKLADFNRNLGRDFEDQQRKAQRKVLQAQVDTQREQVQDFVNHTRSLQDLRRKSNEEELGLRQGRDFKAVFNARKATRIAIQDQQRDFVREKTNKNKKLQQDATDRAIEFQQEREDRLRKFSRDISDTRRKFATEQILAQQNAQAAIMTRRAQFRQESSDLMQQGAQFIQMRQQLGQLELGVMNNVVTGIKSLLGSIQQQQSLGSFGGGATTNNVRNSSSTTNVGGLNINASQLGEAAQGALSVLIGLVT